MKFNLGRGLMELMDVLTFTNRLANNYVRDTRFRIYDSSHASEFVDF